MPASSLDLYVEQGATYKRQLTWQTSANGSPVNLTGYTAKMQVRLKPTSADALLTLVHESGIYLGGAAGTIDLVISAAQTMALPPGDAVYDMVLTNADGEATRFIEGKVTVSRAVTRA